MFGEGGETLYLSKQKKKKVFLSFSTSDFKKKLLSDSN